MMFRSIKTGRYQLTTMHEKEALEHWVERIRDKEMPSFGKIIREILKVTSDRGASVPKLAEVILQDVSMTTRVLKLSNSVVFNPLGLHISTVSRAVITLGFDTVRDISLSVAMVDALVHGGNKKQLVLEMARSIHSAIQAREIARRMNDPAPEEVFIAALLRNIGDLVFWSFSADIGEQVLEMVNKSGCSLDKAQEKVLGFKLDKLSSSLRSEWKLTDQTATHRSKIRGKTVELAYQVAMESERQGWDSPAIKQVLETLSDHTAMPEEDVVGMVHRGARNASQVATFLGAAHAGKSIPLPGEKTNDQDVVTQPLIEQAEITYPQPDGALQLKILRELAQQIEDDPDFNMVIGLAMEGIYRGVGMDRCLFAALTPDKKSLKAKSVLEAGNSGIKNNFQFYRQANLKNIFFLMTAREATSWVDIKERPEIASFVTSEVISVVGKAPFLVAPVTVSGKLLGLIYADRSLSGRAIDHEAYESFSYFVKQANAGLSLSHYRKQGRSGH